MSINSIQSIIFSTNLEDEYETTPFIPTPPASQIEKWKTNFDERKPKKPHRKLFTEALL